MSGLMVRARLGSAAVLVAGVAGFAAAAVGVAIARTFTLQGATGARVTNTAGMSTRENIVVNARGHAVYELTGDARRHPKCTRANGCFSVWPPVTVSSPGRLSKTRGVNGALGVWRRDGFWQVTLGGHPLYTFAPDTRKDVAGGQGIQSFGGTWHVVKTG